MPEPRSISFFIARTALRRLDRTGREAVERVRRGRWGTGIIGRLAIDLRKEFPGMKGFSASNIWRMRAFYAAWSEPALILAQPVRELNPAIRLQPMRGSGVSILPEVLAELPWGHNVTLLEQLKDPAERLWYAKRALEHGWSRNVLVHQIETGLHLRQGKALTNFRRTLPPPRSELAQEALKDEYALDSLMTTDMKERAIERRMIDHVQSFLLELGAGFAFVGRQRHREVGGEDFFLDLLFYHLRLRCYVIVEIKAGAFKPEHAGKMSFYLAAADDLLRHPDDAPSIGIILCKSQNKVVAEYALRDMGKPIGVSSYRATRDLPKGLEDALPGIRELETGIMAAANDAPSKG